MACDLKKLDKYFKGPTIFASFNAPLVPSATKSPKMLNLYLIKTSTRVCIVARVLQQVVRRHYDIQVSAVSTRPSLMCATHFVNGA